MSAGRERVRACPHCGNEKFRTVSQGAYRYYCHCRLWKVHMAVLEHARRRERPQRPAPEPALAAG